MFAEFENSERREKQYSAAIQAEIKRGEAAGFYVKRRGHISRGPLTRMRPTKLMVFGSPRAGTPAMLATPSLAIDLPLKLLISEDEKGIACVSYNSLDDLAERRGIPRDLLAPLAAIEGLAAAATAEQ